MWVKCSNISYVIPEIVLPDGKTVTPTDDIQILLNCAGIYNKPTYTTLAQVLADEDTLRTVINSNNAIDYLARSTSWAAAISVPVMTSNTTPSGVCSTNSSYGSGYEAYKAFDNNSSTQWVAARDASVGTYLRYQFDNPIVCSSATLKHYNNSVTQPKYKIQASNDGTTWTDVTEEITAPTADAAEETVGLDTHDPYAYYQVYITYKVSTITALGLTTLQFYSSSITSSESAMKYIGANDYASTTLLDDETWCEAIVSSDYTDYVANVQVPTMTSDTTPSGVCSATSINSGYQPYRAFDKLISINDLAWESAGGVKSASLRYDFGADESKRIYCLELIGNPQSSGYHTTSPKDFNIEYSDDGSTWTDDSETYTYTYTYGVEEFACFVCSITSPHRGFGINIHNNYGGNNLCVRELQFYGRETGGVQSWLLSAGITDKTYTTLAEVFNDSTTLKTLMNSENAVDYLVTAKGWATTFASSATVMTAIGVSNYASDTLLNDSTWREAICNSTYFESVLNVKVPVMTSATTPSGECFASSYDTTYYPYRAFDGDTGSYWFCRSGNSTLGYDFGTSVNVYYAVLRQSSQSPSTYNYAQTIQTSSTGSEWSDATTSTAIVTTSSQQEYTYTFVSSSSRYYRVYTASSNDRSPAIFEMQFYGRKDVVPGDDVQGWLEAAGITDKPYTTISEVLADTTVLATLMASTDAVDYLVAQTDWATEVCSDSNAMTYIGLNNYAANTLLADDTWAMAIGVSTHVESVMNLSIPAMTSSTTPTGYIPFAASYTGESLPYCAFDKNDATCWQCGSRWNTIDSNNYIGVVIGFGASTADLSPRRIRIAKCKKGTADSKNVNCCIQASTTTMDPDYGSHTLSDTVAVTSSTDVVTILCDDTTAYPWFKFAMPDETTPSSSLSFNGCQLYGREDI